MDKKTFAKGEPIQLHYSLINTTSARISILLPVYNIYQNGQCNTLQVKWNDSLGRSIEKNILNGYDINPPYTVPPVETRTIGPGDSVIGAIRLPFGQQGQAGTLGGWHHEYILRSGNSTVQTDTLPAGNYTLLLNYAVAPDFPCQSTSAHWSGTIRSDTVRFYVR